MIRKLLLVALVCVSFAQVHGDQLENTIQQGLQKSRGMYEVGNDKLQTANQNIEHKRELISSTTTQLVEKANRIQECSRLSLRNIADAMEKTAKENGRSQYVFDCIRRNEQRANTEIDSFTRKFAGVMENLKNARLEEMNTVAAAWNALDEALKTIYGKTNREIYHCKNTQCVRTALNEFSAYLNSFYTEVKNVEIQGTAASGVFHVIADQYFTSSNRLITEIRSEGIRNIRNCYYRAENSLSAEDCQDCQESQ